MKGKLTEFFLLVAAIVAGHFLGNVCADSLEPFISWMGFAISFGFDSINIDIDVLQLTIGFHMSINFLQIVLILLVVALGPQLRKALA